MNSPPPPPPPPMTGPNIAGSIANTNTNSNNIAQYKTQSKPTAEQLQSVKLKKTSPVVNTNESVDPRTNLLAAIRHGIKLKRVEETNARDVEKVVPLHDVASILARRVAMQLSDSDAEPEDGDESDGWDDETEC